MSAPPATQLGLQASPAAGAGTSVASTLESPSRTEFPDLIEYAHGAVAWRCTQFNLLRAEVEALAPADLPRFHEVVAVSARRWRIVRLLFGFQPVLPAPDYPEEELREWGRLELCDTLGLTRPQLKAELDAVRGVWLGAGNAQGAFGAGRPALKDVMPKPPPRDELPLEEDPVLKQYGFEVALTVDEREWFIRRVKEFEKVLKEPMVGGLGHNALVTDLRCRRLNRKLETYEAHLIGNKDWKDTLALAEKLAENYNALIQQILELFPAASNIAGKQALQPVLATITAAIQEYQSRNTTRLIDGIFTATEIQVECRRSQQMAEPRYRAGLVVYLNAAKAGLFDPKWRPPFEARELARLDAAWKAAYMAAADAQGVPVPDLLVDGPAGEYPDLVVPEE